MKIVLTQVEFESMASAWVYENLVEKKMTSATIVDDAIELEVFSANDAPKPEPEEPEEPELEEPYEYQNR